MARRERLWVCLSVLISLALQHGVTSSRTRKAQSNRVRPNIVLVMTDDQDLQLGSMDFMPKTLGILKDGGAEFTNTFTNSPICCPSRSSFLSGRHVHNHNVWTNNENCSSQYWRDNFERKSFATFLQNSGYLTGYFGKYLNEYDGAHIPAGWTEWMGLIKNSAFYNYTLNFNGNLIRHGNNYEKDYLTDLIANDSLTFFKQSKLYNPDKPVAMVLSMPAPHGPEDSAPQYNRMFENITAHRTPSWNYAPNPDKEYLLQITGKMEPIQAHFTDLLMRKRVQTLQSVDDAVQKVYNELRSLGELDNTYIIYISDHGYHLGQFGIPKGKSMPYDFDTRIPLYIRGPGVKPGAVINNLAGIIDIFPTLLDIGGISVPEELDGKSLKPLLDDSYLDDGVVQKKAWRDTYIIERGKLRSKLLDQAIDDDLKENFLPIYFTRTGNVEKKCDKPKYQYPCAPRQKFYCHEDSLGRKRIRKCNKLTKSCPCSTSALTHPIRLKRQADGSFVQKCFIVAGAVQCTKLDAPIASTDWETQKQALDSLIEEYREQLDKLKDLREDIQTNYGNIDYDKYRISSTPMSISSHLEVYNGSTTTTTLITDLLSYKDGAVQDGGDCFCADENDLLEHELSASPLDLIDEEEDEEDSKEQDLLLDDALDLDSLTTREQKRLERQHRREEKKRERQLGRHKFMKCAPHDRRCLRKQKKKMGKASKRNNPHCQVEGAECTVMDNEHWRTEPRWTEGPFCFCNNAQSNVYWCIRTINDTHNFLYCEYINGFLSYYDARTDPWMLRNAIHDLTYVQLGQLHQLLIKLRKCKGSKECTYRHREKSTTFSSKGEKWSILDSVSHPRS